MKSTSSQNSLLSKATNVFNKPSSSSSSSSKNSLLGKATNGLNPFSKSTSSSSSSSKNGLLGKATNGLNPFSKSTTSSSPFHSPLSSATTHKKSNFLMTLVLIVISIIIIITSSLGYSINKKCTSVNELPLKLNKMNMGIGVGVILNIILRDLHFIGFTNFSIILLAVFLISIGSVLINVETRVTDSCQSELDKSLYTDIAFGLIGVGIGIIISAVANMFKLEGINLARILVIVFSIIGIYASSIVINMANSCSGNSISSEKTVSIIMLVIEILAVCGAGASFYFMP
jgi:hypothetical protein